MEMIIDLFLKQVKERPKRPSVTDMRGAYTYEELNRRSALLARKLLETCKQLGTDMQSFFLIVRLADLFRTQKAQKRGRMCGICIDE